MTGYSAPPSVTPAGSFRIRRIDLMQFMKVMAVLYALMGIVAIPFVLIGMMLASDTSFALALVSSIAVPVFYAIIGAIASLIGGIIYNIVAQMTGGIQMQLEAAP